jgi:hypothetical protein
VIREYATLAERETEAERARRDAAGIVGASIEQ